MRIEEANRLKDKQNSSLVYDAKANLVVVSDFLVRETSKKHPKSQNQWDCKKQNHISKGGNKIENKMTKLQSFVCGKIGHKVHQCYKRHRQQNAYEKLVVKQKIT